MNPLRGLLRNWSAVERLKRGYYWLNACVGLLAVSLAMVLMLFAANRLSALLGIPPDAPVRSHPNGTLWLVAFLVSIPLSAYVGAVLVAGAFAMVMVRLGKFTATEAWQYALLSRYPASWFKKEPKGQ